MADWLQATFVTGRWQPCDLHLYEVAAALHATHRNSGRIAITCRTYDEAKRVRCRINQIGKSRIHLAPWFWISTRHTLSEPLVVYARIEKFTPSGLRDHFRNFPSDQVEAMLLTPPRCALKVRSHRYARGEDPLESDEPGEDLAVPSLTQGMTNANGQTDQRFRVNRAKPRRFVHGMRMVLDHDDIAALLWATVHPTKFAPEGTRERLGEIKRRVRHLAQTYDQDAG